MKAFADGQNAEQCGHCDFWRRPKVDESEQNSQKDKLKLTDVIQIITLGSYFFTITKRKIPDQFDTLYGGAQWVSLTRDSVNSILDYTKRKPSFYKRLWMTFAPEECYFHTLLVNIKGKKNIAPWNCRFIRWRFENGHSPANLGLEHFHFLVENEYLFARKMEKPFCVELIKSIDKYLLNDNDIVQTDTGGWIYNGILKYTYEEAFSKAIVSLCDLFEINFALDIGCGDGRYVAEWRREGISFSGYDANPYTPILSQLFLGKDDEPCGVADITDELQVEDTFDLVVCKDVLQFVPDSLLGKAIDNLTKLTSSYLLLNIVENDEGCVNSCRNSLYKKDLILLQLKQKGFSVNECVSKKFEKDARSGSKSSFYFLERNNVYFQPVPH